MRKLNRIVKRILASEQPLIRNWNKICDNICRNGGTVNELEDIIWHLGKHTLRDYICNNIDVKSIWRDNTTLNLADTINNDLKNELGASLYNQVMEEYSRIVEETGDASEANMRVLGTPDYITDVIEELHPVLHELLQRAYDIEVNGA